ncbi:MAG: SulP family inorganic anion transporter [Bacteroidetes bacterium]|nr:SulP family inorganic anion transporter [Bacteroidota bacterium]
MKTNFKHDIKSSIVLFLVALPLCLGIALASNAPIISGVIAGIVGGIIVGAISGSHTSVSGPAAGLTIIVLNGITSLNNFEAFLLVVILAGIFQIILAKIKAGVIGDFIPGAVISGMLVSIGLLLMLKQIPHALGFDSDYEGDEEFSQADGKNTFTEIYYAILDFNTGAIIIALISILILLAWQHKRLQKIKLFNLIPAQLIVVLLGICINLFFTNYFPKLALSGYHLSEVPIIDSNTINNWPFPDFSAISNPTVWKLSITIALVASIETLLSIQAGDKIDPFNRTTPANKELLAQGTGNIISGFLGGLPITAVIVRTSANVNSGARSKWSAIYHGVFLILSVFFLTSFINIIPKAALAAILLHVGYKLAKPSIFIQEFKRKKNRFIPFLITILAILLTDLLIGVVIGVISGILFILLSNYRTSIMLYKDHNNYLLRFHKDASFFNKKLLKQLLADVPDNSKLLIDSTKADFIDSDIIETIDDFIKAAKNKNINITIKTSTTKPKSIFKIDHGNN